MCDSRYDPTQPLPAQLEQLLHHMSGWADATAVIEAQLPTLPIAEAMELRDLDPTMAKLELRAAAEAFTAARFHTLQALRLYLAGDRNPRTRPAFQEMSNAEARDHLRNDHAITSPAAGTRAHQTAHEQTAVNHTHADPPAATDG